MAKYQHHLRLEIKKKNNPDLNNLTLVGTFRSGTLAKAHITYRAALAYGNVNMSFYHTSPYFGEQEFKFNFKVVPVYLQALKEFNNAKWSAGIHYLFFDTKIASTRDSLPAFVANKEVSSIISQIGGMLQYDGRDNLFTPNKGIRFETDFFWSGSVIGSDYNSWRINYSAIGYTPITPKFIGGLRIEGQQSLGSPPFYLLPYVDLRGVPAARYQGNATLLTEARWDFYKRWSAVFYGGVGEAYDNWNNMFADPLVYSYGIPEPAAAKHDVIGPGLKDDWLFAFFNGHPLMD